MRPSSSHPPPPALSPVLIRIFDHFADAQQARSALLEQGFPPHAVDLDTVGDEAGPVQGKAAWRGMFRLVVAVRHAQERERAHAILQTHGGSDIEQRTASHGGGKGGDKGGGKGGGKGSGKVGGAVGDMLDGAVGGEVGGEVGGQAGGTVSGQVDAMVGGQGDATVGGQGGGMAGGKHAVHGNSGQQRH